jgi:AcrR family transcriptional regulator
METLTRRGRPKNEEMLAQRREDILASATEMFSQYGYQRTDIQAIADGLGLGKGTIYRYFESKQELFLATVDRGMAGVSKHIAARTDAVQDPIQKLAEALRAFLGYFDDHPEVVELLIQERAEFRDRAKPTFQAHREKNIGPWHALLAQMMDEGRVRRMNVEIISRVISNAMYGKLFTTYFNPERRSFASQTDELLAVVFGGILSEQELQNWQHLFMESQS